jgi:hypothetical protein
MTNLHRVVRLGWWFASGVLGFVEDNFPWPGRISQATAQRLPNGLSQELKLAKMFRRAKDTALDGLGGPRMACLENPAELAIRCRHIPHGPGRGATIDSTRRRSS